MYRERNHSNLLFVTLCSLNYRSYWRMPLLLLIQFSQCEDVCIMGKSCGIKETKGSMMRRRAKGRAQEHHQLRRIILTLLL
jgi:hypothetical protein